MQDMESVIGVAVQGGHNSPHPIVPHYLSVRSPLSLLTFAARVSAPTTVVGLQPSFVPIKSLPVLFPFVMKICSCWHHSRVYVFLSLCIPSLFVSVDHLACSV